MVEVEEEGVEEAVVVQRWDIYHTLAFTPPESAANQKLQEPQHAECMCACILAIVSLVALLRLCVCVCVFL